MTRRGPQHLRKITNVMLDALVRAAERAGQGRALSRPLLESVVEGIKTSREFDPFFERSYQEMLEIIEADRAEQRRFNVFGRLMIEPLGRLFETGRLDRALVSNLFAFLHMILGDEAERTANRCREIVELLREERGDAFLWSDFFADAEARSIRWRTLIAIARSFKRFEPRKDWFIRLMMNRPTSISIASNAFVPVETDPAAEMIPFGEEEFVVLFTALFAPLIEISPREQLAFEREFGATPEALTGEFLDHLDHSRAR
jgi:hypothetical protein